MIDGIDFCMSFIGENSAILTELFFSTLRRHCDLRDVTFHLVRKQVSSTLWDKIVKIVGELDRPVKTYELDTGWQPYKGQVDSFSFSSHTNSSFNDAAKTAEWIIDNCGESEWCVLSHFDVEWRSDILRWMRRRQSSTGAMMIGSHCPIMLLNRSAYRECGVGFNSTQSEDVGVLLGRVLNAVGFEAPMEMEWCFHHIGGGGGYHTQDEFDSMRRHVGRILRDKLTNTLVGADILPDGSGVWLIHLDKNNVALCGAEARMRTGEPAAVNCPRCLDIYEENRR